ncbi:MAG: hypothetical protein JF885_03540 [Candidatus Dormibacteraeota bacterium]|nr:hypothetical protein [Candidatus Dormibacteraeota bacterium]MBJ7610871.1 hypothetical protein [Candidatus Dormibacteraeota bacterium]
MKPELQVCLETFQRWLQLPPDAGSVLFTLGVVTANRAQGDAVWGLLVGGSGWGKTETLMSLSKQPDVHPAGPITEGALLSGTPKRERGNAKGGLLREIGDFGILLVKDFGSVLSMNRDTRAQVLAALREVYDGSWTRHVGVDGGRTLHWEGKVGMVAGCTPIIDSHHGVMAAMGERFVFYRLPMTDQDGQARSALRHDGAERTMRADLAEASSLVLAAVDGDLLAAPVSDEDRERLIRLATLAVRARSAVERDPRTREIELVPDAEAPGRLALILLRLLKALRALGAEDEAAWTVVQKCALDCVPAVRRQVAEILLGLTEAGTAEVATAIDYPTTTTRRALEDLTAHGLMKRRKIKLVGPKGGSTNADRWSLTPFARERWPRRFPEKSFHTQSAEEREGGDQQSPTDISETCPRCGGELQEARGDPDCYGCEIGDPFCPACNRHANYDPTEGQSGEGFQAEGCPECGLAWSATRPGEPRRCLRGHPEVAA